MIFEAQSPKEDNDLCLAKGYRYVLTTVAALHSMSNEVLSTRALANRASRVVSSHALMIPRALLIV